MCARTYKLHYPYLDWRHKTQIFPFPVFAILQEKIDSTYRLWFTSCLCYGWMDLWSEIPFELCCNLIHGRIVFATKPVGFKVEKILKGSLDSNPSPSHSAKIQIIGGKVSLRYEGKTLQGIFNKLFKTSLLTSPSNVLPHYLK